MSMTARERAEKVADEAKKMGVELRGPVLFPMLLAQIEDAEREAINREHYHEAERIPVYMTKGRSEAYEAGFKAARDKAAEVIDGSGPTPNPIDLAYRIRKMEPSK